MFLIKDCINRKQKWSDLWCFLGLVGRDDRPAACDSDRPSGEGRLRPVSFSWANASHAARLRPRSILTNHSISTIHNRGLSSVPDWIIQNNKAFYKLRAPIIKTCNPSLHSHYSVRFPTGETGGPEIGIEPRQISDFKIPIFAILCLNGTWRIVGLHSSPSHTRRWLGKVNFLLVGTRAPFGGGDVEWGFLARATRSRMRHHYLYAREQLLWVRVGAWRGYCWGWCLCVGVRKGGNVPSTYKSLLYLDFPRSPTLNQTA